MYRPQSRARAVVYRRARPALVLAFTLSTSVPARAGDAATRAPLPEVTLDIDQAARRAAEVSPVVRRARADRGAAEARRVEADILFPSNPAVLVGAGPTRTPLPGEIDTAVGAIAHVEQTVELSGQRAARRAEVSRGIEGASLRETLAMVEAQARGRGAYVAALLAGAQLDSARRREELAAQLEASVRARVDSGAASEIELRLATLERSRVARDRVAATQVQGDAQAELLALLGYAPETRLTLITPLAPPTTPVPSPPEALALAAQRRADLQALDARRSELDATLLRLGREALPSPTLFVDLERDRPGELFVRAGIGVPLPLWRRRQGEAALVRAEQARVDVERAVSARAVALEVDHALRAVALRGEQVRLDREEVVPAAEAALDLLTQGWRAGKFDLFRVIQASREAGEAHRRALEDLGLLWEARIELSRAMGMP